MKPGEAGSCCWSPSSWPPCTNSQNSARYSINYIKYVCSFIHTQTHSHTHTHPHTPPPPHTHTHTHTHTPSYPLKHTHTYTHIHAHTHTYTYTHIYTHTQHTQIHTHTHKYICTTHNPADINSILIKHRQLQQKRLFYLRYHCCNRL